MMYRVFLFLSTGFTLTLGSISALQPMPDEIIPPLGLPAIPWPKDNPYTKDKAELGRLLYFDKRLSSDNSVSCASCHNLECGFSDCKAIAVGINQEPGTRHSPTVINGAYLQTLFWDGRANSLEEQAKGPIANPREMTLDKDAHEAHRQCVERIKSIPGYTAYFKKAYGTNEINIDRIANAIATFERTILSGDSAFDRFQAGDKTALTKQQLQGMKVFVKSNCNNCHGGVNFTDGRFLNIGVGMDRPNPDLGRYGITKDEKDWGAFKVPTLREIDKSAPYMHDGSLKTLEEVVDYYDKGGIPNKNLHNLMVPLNLSDDDKKALVAFLKALSGKGWQHFEEPSSFPN